MVNILSYSTESWYKQMPESSKKVFDIWYDNQMKHIREIAEIKDEILMHAYNLKGSSYAMKPQQIKKAIVKAKEIIPENLMTPNLKVRISELEGKINQ